MPGSVDDVRTHEMRTHEIRASAQKRFGQTEFSSRNTAIAKVATGW